MRKCRQKDLTGCNQSVVGTAPNSSLNTDDFLLMFQYENEAKAVMKILKERLEKFGLQVAEDKTRVLPFGRFAKWKDEFDFLGFAFYNAKSRNGRYRLGIRTSKKKLKVKE